jgi:hypothetical protein
LPAKQIPRSSLKLPPTLQVGGVFYAHPPKKQAKTGEMVVGQLKIKENQLEIIKYRIIDMFHKYWI